MNQKTPIEMSPELFRELGYRAVDILADHLAALNQPDHPARTPVPDDLRERLLAQPPPAEGQEPGGLLEDFSDFILPYPMGNSSPRFFAWVNSPPAPMGILADLLAAGLNPSVAGGDHSATYIEHAVLNWLKSWLCYPVESGGILTSGGSAANLIGLAVMRTVMAKGDVRSEGFRGESQPMTIYTSAQGHSCLQKAIELLGFGSNALRMIPVDADFCMDIALLNEQISSDRKAGFRPVCVAGSAGTVNTGAVDPLDEIADFCEEEKLWFHVDGAYGALGILAEQTGGVNRIFKGIDRADSLAVDPHKWMYLPVECGCALVRDEAAMRDTFSLVPPYLRDDTSLPWFSEFGIQQTRGFKGLKLWMVMQQVGEEGYRSLISRDVDLARKFQELLRSHPDFEVVAGGPLSITCFRYAPPGAGNVDELNRDLLKQLQREGKVYLTSTELDGRPVLRVCFINFRTTEADLDKLLEELILVGQQVLGKS
jgi:glutamate/tyrosine decarboxylase-like PLP-dependent enzyme